MLNNPNTYPIVVRVEKGYVTASQPDLDIYRARGRFEDLKRPDEIGTLVMEVWAEIIERLKTLPDKPPSNSTVALRKDLPAVIGIGKAAELLGVCISTVRSMCDKKKLECYRTNGGHWKIRMKDPIISRLLPKT